MTIRERMNAVYHGKMPDIPPVGIYSRYFPRGSMERSIRNMGCGIIDYYPVATMLSPPWHFRSEFLAEVRECEYRVNYLWKDGTLTYRYCYKTPLGELTQEVRPDQAGIGSEYICKNYIETEKDYLVAKYIVQNTVVKCKNDDVQKRKKALGEDGVVLGRLDRSPYQKLLIELMDKEKFFLDLSDQSELLLELMDVMGKKMDESFTAALETDVDAYWQPDNITSDMTPPRYYEAFCRPFYQKRAAMLRQKGVPYVIHMDGKLSALSHLVRNSDFDVLESFSLPCIGGDLTYPEARKLFKGITIVPNFPSNLCLETEDHIRKFVYDLFKQAEDMPFMLQISEDMPERQWTRILPILCEAAVQHAAK